MTPRQTFWRSRWHLWLALLTVGLGFASGEPLGLLAGATAYALGLIYLPDSGWYRRIFERETTAVREAEAAQQRAAFAQERDRLLDMLHPGARTRLQTLVSLGQEIESATQETQRAGGAMLGLETHLRKLDELVWTYLRLLVTEQSLEAFLESERRDRLTEEITETEASLTALVANTEDRENRERLIASKRERLNALRERLDRGKKARGHLDLAKAEQQRIVDVMKLLRADIIATRNPDTLSQRIDHSVDHLNETNRWLGEIAELKEMTTHLPPGFERLELDAAAPARGQTRNQPNPTRSAQ